MKEMLADKCITQVLTLHDKEVGYVGLSILNNLVSTVTHPMQ